MILSNVVIWVKVSHTFVDVIIHAVFVIVFIVHQVDQVFIILVFIILSVFVPILVFIFISVFVLILVVLLRGRIARRRRRPGRLRPRRLPAPHRGRR